MSDPQVPPEIDPHGNVCLQHGVELEYVECWKCFGEGGFHDCGEDCCACLDKEEITEVCDECKGAGGYLICPECAPGAFE